METNHECNDFCDWQQPGNDCQLFLKIYRREASHYSQSCLNVATILFAFRAVNKHNQPFFIGGISYTDCACLLVTIKYHSGGTAVEHCDKNI